MVRGSVARLTGKAGALAVAIAVLAGTPVFAAPSSSDATLAESAKPSQSSDSLTGTSKTTRRTTSSADTLDSGTRKPPSKGSEINVGVDKRTSEYRRNLLTKQQRLDRFENQLYALDRELELATEEYNDAVDKLDKMKQHVDVAQEDLDKARDAYSVQTDILGSRASKLYKDGNLNIVEMLLDADSVGDFIARAKFLNTMGIRDADIAASLKGQKQLLEQRVDELEGAQVAAESLEFELKARQIEIMLRIQERQQMFADAQTDLLELLDVMDARRQAAESQLLAEILSGASGKGIQATSGTPVETALAYHGVPYLWGGETPRGFDCSGLVLYVFAQHGVQLPHYSGSQFRLGEKVTSSAMVPGDVVFFGSPIHHVGLYMGGGYYIHAPRTGDFVKISKLADRSDFAGARRYAWRLRADAPKNAVKTTEQALKGYSGTR